MILPYAILSHIFSFIPIHERWILTGVCKLWYRICYDPYLYRHIEFDNLEFRPLVCSLQRISSMLPRIQSISIRNCYSKFIQNTVVPVYFSHSRANDIGPMLFSHITALQPPRRRNEYLKHQFELHNLFSDTINDILESSKDCLKSISISGCTLDLEMTELFCSLVCHSHALQKIVYTNNHDKGISSSGLLQAIVISCPNMKHFIGIHSGMDDAVLGTIARHWKQLESLTLSSLKNREILGHLEIFGEGNELRGSLPAGLISHNAFWQLLSECQHLTSLELNDLACISNSDLLSYEQQQHGPPTKKGYQPYRRPPKKFVKPGSSIRQLSITKYMTTPLSKLGFESLLRLFPNLNQLKYETNFHTFNNLFEGITRDMFEAERLAVQNLFSQKTPNYLGHWNTEITAEQRLMAGMTSVSEVT